MTTDELNIRITADTGNTAETISKTADSIEKLGENAKTADTDVSQFAKIMADAAQSMVQVSQNIANSASMFSGFQGGIDAVQSSLQGLSFRFDTLNASIQSSYTAFDGAAASVTELSTASEQSAAGLNSIVTVTDGFASRMSDLQTATQGAADGMGEFRRDLSGGSSSIREFSDSMGTAGRDAEEAAKKIRQLTEDVSALVARSKAGSNAALSLAAGFGKLKGVIATLGIAKVIRDSNNAYKVQMENELKLTSHMKHRMNATDEEIQSVRELASAQQRLGVIGDEIQLAGAQQLTTYAKQSSTLKTLIPAMNNLIAQTAGYDASVGSATSTADMLGRALNGQYTSLKRMGVSFTEAQEQVLKYGTESQKAAVLADAINSKVGNMNALLAQTPTGKLKQLQNEFGDLQEQLGATFQPLISAIIPVARNVLNTLAPPIMAVSRGIATIGSAIASIDSPAVRGIALAAAGIAIVNKLKLALGGTGAALLVVGTALSWLIGSLQGEQESITDTVNSAYNAAAGATETATDAAKEYEEQLVDVQKAANRLAGFDTITKLSGGSGGSLAAALFDEGDLANLQDLSSAAIDAQDAFDSIQPPNFDFSSATQKAETFLSNLDFVFKHWGDDGAVMEPLTNMTTSIENILNAVGFDGTKFVEFWEGIGNQMYTAFNGNGTEGWSMLTKGIEDLLNGVGLDGSGFVDFWKGVGRDISNTFTDISNGMEKLSKGDFFGAVGEFEKAFVDKPGTSENIKDAWAALEQGNVTGANVLIDKELKDQRDILSTINDALSGAGNNYMFFGDGGKTLSDALQRLGANIQKATQNNISYGEAISGVDLSETVQERRAAQYSATSTQPTTYTDIPMKPAGMPDSAWREYLAATYVNVYVNDEKSSDFYVEKTNGIEQQ